MSGKWSTDQENRSNFSSAFLKRKEEFYVYSNKYIEEAEKYAEKYFPKNPGVSSGLYLPISREGALKHLSEFVKKKLHCFAEF